MSIAHLPLPVPAKSRRAKLPRMTEAEFVAWCGDDGWAEWGDGEVGTMNAVEADNSEVIGFAQHLIRGFVDAHQLGKVYAEPFQLRLPRQRRRRSPDVMFAATANLGRIRRMELNGPADLIVEVVSPDSRKRDRRDKFGEYQKLRVPEYWILDRAMRAWDGFALDDRGRYAPIPVVRGKVHSRALPGLFFRPEWVWQLAYPPVAPLLRQMARGRRTLLSTSPPPASDNPET